MRLPAAALLLACAACGVRDASAPGILLVTVDTFRADRAGCMGDPRGLTPALDRVARRGFQCREAYAPAPLTAVSHATILTGLDPPRHGVRENTAHVLADSASTLASLLSGAGFHTVAVVAAFPLISRWGFSTGFQHFDDELDSPEDPRSPLLPERPGSRVGQEAVDRVRALPREEPYFLWAHFFDPHYPYEAQPPLSRLPGAGEYEREVRGTDREIGRLLRNVATVRGRRPLVLVASDHGEALGDHGELSHGTLLFGETMQAFVAGDPGEHEAGWPRGIVTGPVKLADVYPTLLEAAGLHAPEELDGVSLARGVPAERGIYGEGYHALAFGWSPLLSWRDARWTYVEGPVPELYDRSADPGELHDVASEQPEVVRALSREIAGVARPPEPPGAASLDPETEARLLALGYAGTGGAPPDFDPSKNPRELISCANDLFRGMGLMGKGRAQEAAAFFRRAHRKDPTNSTVLFRLADCLRTLNEPAALDYYRRAVDVDPGQAEAWSHLAVLLFDSGRREEALGALEEGLRTSPLSFPLLMTAGDLHVTLGEKERARDFYALAEERYPWRPEPAEKRNALGGQ